LQRKSYCFRYLKWKLVKIWLNLRNYTPTCKRGHTAVTIEQDNQTKVEIQQKWKYKKTFNSSGQSCVSNMKLFCPVIAEASVAQIVCRQTDNRLTWWLQYAPSYKWGIFSFLLDFNFCLIILFKFETSGSILSMTLRATSFFLL
jgi:hypothetical protein